MSVPGNITRVKTHLLTCQKFLTSEAAQKVAESNQEVAAKLKALKEKRGGQTTLTGLPVGAGGSGAGSSAGSGSSTGAGRSASAFPVKVYPKYSAADIEEHNEAIAIFLYGCNQPLSLVEHPDFQQMVFTLAPHMKGKLIGRKALATTMLDKRDLVVAAAIVDPRYKDKLSSMPAADVVRGEAFIEQLAGRMMGQQAQTKAKGQLMNYKSRPREIGITPAAVAATQTAGVAPETFWTDISHSCAELSEVARMLLSIPPTSATSERVFSAVSQVWDTGRSCMASARVRKLLFIYFNRKALSRDGAVRDAEDFAAYVKWLDSLNNEEEQEKQQQQQQQQQEQQ
ncbi:hypothetical protein OEZ86_004981 [Tetradesmus obliquus]|nr:hypothetical protein OEZ86_004981 [Tetradesmus obliquus]